MRTSKEIRSDYEEIVRAFAEVSARYDDGEYRVMEVRERAKAETAQVRKRMEATAELMRKRVDCERDIAFAVVSLRKLALQAECTHPNREPGNICPECCMSETGFGE